MSKDLVEVSSNLTHDCLNKKKQENLFKAIGIEKDIGNITIILDGKVIAEKIIKSQVTIQGIEIPDPYTLNEMFKPIQPRKVTGIISEAEDADYEVVEENL